MQATIKARFVAPVSAPVIENGAVQISGDTIAAIGSAREVPAQGEVFDYGDAVIIPGLVNAHTHLELSHLAGKVSPGTDFADWLSRLAPVLPHESESIASAVRLGIASSVAAGVTVVGDITRFPGITRRVLSESPVRAVSFGEVIAIGRIRAKLGERIQAALHDGPQTAELLHGISPHAPYTVESNGLEQVAVSARTNGAPLCIHAAESEEEEEFTCQGIGPLRRFLEHIGVWDDFVPIPRRRPIELLEHCGLLTPPALLAHANYVSDSDIVLIARCQSSVAYCPRTHAAFGHREHRFRQMMQAGVNVCIGTDSLASNPSLSVLDELRYLHAHYPQLSADTLLGMGTLHGAKALGLETQCGSLEVGKAADLAVYRLRSVRDRWESLLNTDDAPWAVWARGMLREPPLDGL